MIVSSNENETDAGLGVITLEDEPQLKEPPLFPVVLLNDDFTPMEFVVYAVQKVFGYEHERATQIILSVHTKGKGVCGIFPKEIAEMKCAEMSNLAQINEHPLLTEIEPMTD